MPRECGKCGEELLGSVNRCWRCGEEFISVGVATDTQVESVDPQLEVASSAIEAIPVESTDDLPSKPEQHIVATVIEPAGQVENINNRPLPAPYATDQMPAMAAVAGFVLGIGSVVGCWWTAWMLLPAGVGILFSIAGLGSRQQKLAVVGAALCLVALTVSGYLCVCEIFFSMYGYYPLEIILDNLNRNSAGSI
jgi:hypothetical protein